MKDTDDKNIYSILIVDDSDFSRQSISQMLDAPHYKIVGEAANAKEAINILGERKVDVVIIDVVMPETSGIELADLLSKNFSRLSIIMISSLAQENVIIDSISAGASDFLQKPFTKLDLVTSIEKALDQNHRE